MSLPCGFPFEARQRRAQATRHGRPILYLAGARHRGGRSGTEPAAVVARGAIADGTGTGEFAKRDSAWGVTLKRFYGFISSIEFMDGDLWSSSIHGRVSGYPQHLTKSRVV